MKHKSPASDQDPEIVAISAVYTALKNLNQESQKRVIDYVCGKLGLKRSEGFTETDEDSNSESLPEARTHSERAEQSGGEGTEELEGISPVARKWMRRNGLTAAQLSAIFSLGVDEIDLVARTVPGGRVKKEKMRSVLLLKGLAAYLGTGIARFTHEQAKEACLHYDAYDLRNFASYLRGMMSEISGNKESGYQLSARGLTSATEIVKQLSQPQKPGS
jgi:hypothetical protein